MKQKYSTNFRLERRKDSQTKEIIKKNIPILLDFTFDGKRLQYFTGYRIDFNKWDTLSQRVRRNNFNKDLVSAQTINEHLSNIEKHVSDIYKEAKTFNTNPTPYSLKEELKKRLNEPVNAKKGFFDYFSDFTESESKLNDWTSGTITKFKTNINHLKEFQKKSRTKIEFDNMDERFFSRYLEFQRDILDHRNTTVGKNLKILKWFLNWAVKKGYNKNLFFKDFKPELKGTTRTTKIIFLTWDELMHVYKLKISKKYLETTRDVFCFCCFTGLRYSDVFNLKRSNIKNGTIEITTIKTDEVLTIDLNDFSKAIIEKYKSIPFKEDKCLPVISNQKMNDYIKEVGKLAKLDTPETVVYFKGPKRIEESYKKWELLSTHTGRKTFISNALFLNIPSEVIMTWTGHKSHKVMENYYKIVNDQKRREMNKFNQ